MYRDEVLADGPIGYWRLGESSGTTAVDESPNGNDGTYEGGPTLGKPGALAVADTAVGFDGIDDRVTTALELVTGAAERTYEAWVKTTAVDAFDAIIEQGPNNAGERFTMRINGDQSLGAHALRVDVQGGFIIGTTVLNDGAWHHIVAVLPPASTDVLDVLLYVDSSLEAISHSGSQLLNTQPGNPIKLGWGIALNRWYDGDMDEAAVYDVALSAARIQAHFDARLDLPPDQPVCSVAAVGETTVDLVGSAYSDPNGDPHAASQWQVDEAGGDFSVPVYDSGSTADLEAHTATGLPSSTDLIARVRYQDADGDWSLWSDAVAFTTKTPGVWSQCSEPTSAFVQCADPVDQSQIGGELEKVAHGFVWKSIGGDAASPLDPAEWTHHVNDTLQLIGSGDQQGLELLPPNLDQHYRMATADPVGSRGEALVYAILTHWEGEPERDVVLRVGLAGLMAPGDYSDAQLVGLASKYRMHEDVTIIGDEIFLSRLGDTPLNAGDEVEVRRSVADLHRDIGHKAWHVFWVDPAGQFAVFDGFAAQSDPSVLEAVHDIATNGLIGFSTNSSSALAVTPRGILYRIFVAAARYVTVTSAPTGSTAEVRDAAGAVLSTGPEAGGQILVDMMVLGDQVWDPDPVTGFPTNPGPDDAVEIAVRNSLGAEIASLTPEAPEEGVWGGDTYDLTVAPAWKSCAEPAPAVWSQC